MSFTLKMRGSEDFIAKYVRAGLPPSVFKTITGNTVVEIMKRIAPYPPVPPRKHPRKWYERGFGWKYRRLDGTVTGKRTSEKLGTRWRVVIKPDGSAELQNSASYSKYVHNRLFQARVHKRTGWKTDDEVTKSVIQDGTVRRIAGLAIKRFLGE